MDDANLLYEEALRLARRDRTRNADRVVALLKRAAAMDHAMANHALGLWYLQGIGLRRNYRKGTELEMKAARAGIAEAAFNVAHSFETGKGVGKDPAAALRFYKRAARLGYTDALYEIGRLYAYGIGVSRNRRLAERWYGRARASGHLEALEDEQRRLSRKRVR